MDFVVVETSIARLDSSRELSDSSMERKAGFNAEGVAS